MADDCTGVVAYPTAAAGCAHRLLVSGFFSTVDVYDASSGAYIQVLDAQSKLAGAQAIRIGPDGLVYVVAEQDSSVYRSTSPDSCRTT